MSTANGTPSTSPAQPIASPNPTQAPPSQPSSQPPSQPPSQTQSQPPSQPQSQPLSQPQAQAQPQPQPNATATTIATQEKKEEEKEKEEADIFAARREEENARRDRSLAEFLVMLDGYKPLIPEEVTEYYLQRAGFECQDPRLKRLLSLSAQKFISDLSRDAFHFAKLRVSSTAAGRGRPAAGADRNRVVLTMDDLSLALGEHGVNVKKPDYYL
ncbi:hypothetical protein CcaverHIS002_0600620 [Cutaneotrichosporon cavernicola]|uniref:Transcription initiation factor TFIID subunit 10 n=1 Tax=Cutaneotrichosporon cavernicola TaxID=279322 RepID=A0AA48L5S8_9TREE|nr:uncharacterized protein CcaverHIS019_0500710 [Cutaneotrichosporon cavernicola]BEI85775.1 hypothetical protein CcaverHIS002_0600620 [Cutaneotrichosporon cavernicola]BEI92443.1 hypothetical protein CcaverHIS019_0500710 [Cutaneotrichosporon cavernicola]BEJ00216.1 hypothetical protein CcaverHIS631_0500730 [Cutaneotrichosporon cavernicola]BEJ07987.1 hypothetical protein CcaverHIS641_0500720 [Cutaneotrichosporon cavernicola]